MCFVETHFSLGADILIRDIRSFMCWTSKHSRLPCAYVPSPAWCIANLIYRTHEQKWRPCCQLHFASNVQQHDASILFLIPPFRYIDLPGQSIIVVNIIMWLHTSMFVLLKVTGIVLGFASLWVCVMITEHPLEVTFGEMEWGIFVG
jgi:hypothetical protein